MAVTVKTDDSVGELLELLRERGNSAGAARALVTGVNLGSQILQGIVVKERFTGQGPFPVSQKKLGVVSSRLRRTVRFGQARLAGKKLVVEAGSNVKYWARHEFGGRGRTVKVKAAKVKSYQVPNAFGKGKTLTIKAHVRKAYSFKDRTPKREPLQAGIREHGGRVYAIQIEKRLMMELEGGVV